MKKFLIAAVALLLAALGGWYAVFCRGFYLPSDGPVTAAFRTEGKSLLRQAEDGSWTPFSVKGVDVSSSMPGHYASEFAPEEADYLRWLTAIGEMGANTVRVYTVMDDDFYNALYTYNTTHEEPLYLLQGIQVSDAANNGCDDAYSDAFLGTLLTDGRDAVDVIHGRKSISNVSGNGGGFYHRDLSPWTLGYLVGQEWNSGTIAYTNHSSIRSGTYEGRYFTTAPDATAFEAMLAQVMDTMASYESDKYKTQRLLAFVNDPADDPLVYTADSANQLSKYNRLDAERVLPAAALKSGYFAAYQLYDFCSDFSRALTPEQQTALGEAMSRLDSAAPYGGYLELLSAHHTVPVVAAGYSATSARGATDPETPPLTERQQGEALTAAHAAALNSGWSGGCISAWQDTWERRAWNTAFAVDTDRNYLWHDLQTDGQNCGLLAFDPGAERRVCLLDGDPSEWSPEDAVLTADGRTLSVRTDEEGLYLLLQGADVGPETPLYLPLDLTEESGSTTAADPALTFDRAADFLLCLDGRDNTRLLVQERYDALRENFLAEITGADPFVSFPASDSPVFVPVSMVLRNDTLVDTSAVTPEEAWRLRLLETRETGRLTHGNGDPDSAAYNSLADFCFGKNCVEIRLPWLLLNVGDPSQMRVHSDYYDYYGVRTHAVSRLWLGTGDGSAAITLSPVSLKGWNQPETHERLKESYEVVRAAWKGDESTAS